MPGPAQAVAAAARGTLALGSARFERQRFIVAPELREPVVVQTDVGVADLARPRTAFEQIVVSPAGTEVTEQRLVGRTVYVRAAGAWHSHAEDVRRDDRRHPSDPLWIVDALRFADRADARDEAADVRGARCRRFGFLLELAALGALLELPKGQLDAFGEVCIDDDERVRRVTWRHVPARRRARRREGQGRQVWDATELWEFGVAVEIAVPPARPLPRHPGE